VPGGGGGVLQNIKFQAPNLRVLGFPPEADQVSLLRPPGFGGQAGTRFQVSGVWEEKKKLNPEH
jgi:hypothetical protein